MKKVTLTEITMKLESGSRPKGGVNGYSIGIPSLGGEHLDSNGGFRLDSIKLVPREFFESMEKGRIHREDILIVKDGATTGKTSFISDDFQYLDACINEHVFRLELDRKRAYPKYVFYYLFSPMGRRGILKDFRGATVGGISRSFTDGIEIPLPPLPEQKRIADILDKADAIRRKRREATVMLSKATSSLFFHEFGDPLFNPKEWEVVLLADVCHKITDGVHLKPKYTETGVPFVSVKDITTGKLRFDNVKYISEEDHRAHIKACKPEFGDVLLTKVGATYGRPALVDTDKPFSLYVSVALLKPNCRLIDAVFLKEVLASEELKRQADRSIKGAGVPDLHLVEIRKFRIPLPPLPVQQAFVAKTRVVHALEQKLLDAADKKDRLFNSLLQRAFKGCL